MLFARGFLLVTLVSMNTVQIARQQFLRAACGGFCISLVWYFNAHGAAMDGSAVAGIVYAAGAALGTFTGMKLAGKR